MEAGGARQGAVGRFDVLEHLGEGKWPETKDAEKEYVEGPEEDSETVQVVIGAG